VINHFSKDFNKINKKDNLLLVLGSEGEGVSRTIESFAS
jgi:tRNA G18 (ribose-2'-O)-methylase SpoU